MKPSERKFKFYRDASHGWLAVKIDLIESLGIRQKITQYSYKKGNTAYLEEDCDAPLFIEAYKKAFCSPVIELSKSQPDRSPIRSYGRFF